MSDGVDGSEAGWTRYYATSSALLQRDLTLFADDTFTGDPVLSVAGENRAAEILDASGSVVMTVLTKGINLSRFEYTDPAGAEVATLKINSVLSKTYMELTRAGGGSWTVVKDAGVKQSYVVLADGAPVVRMNLSTLVLQRNYPVDIADSVDLPLAGGVVWAVNFAHLRKSGAAGAAAGG